MKENDPRAYKLRRTVITVQQGNMKVPSCYTKLISVWDEIRLITPTLVCSCQACTCDTRKEINIICEKESLYKFINGAK